MQIRQLSSALRKKAEEELSETPSRITSSLKILRDWLKQQPHLHSVKPTDQWLIAFLRGCKYDIEKCKGKIDMYYTLKGSAPEFFGNRDPFDEHIQEMLKLGVFLPLKKSMPEDSPRTCVSRLGPYCIHSKRSLADFIKVSLMIIEIMLLEDDNFTISGEVIDMHKTDDVVKESRWVEVARIETVRRGILWGGLCSAVDFYSLIMMNRDETYDVIVDLNGLGLRMIWQWTPALAKKVTACSEKALSVRLKSMHLLNAPYGLGGALAVFKMFLGAKIKNRIFSHSKDTLRDKIDKSILPEEYGGTDGTVQELIDYWKSKVESYREWFLDETAYSDESKRPVSSKSTGGFFGW